MVFTKEGDLFAPKKMKGPKSPSKGGKLAKMQTELEKKQTELDAAVPVRSKTPQRGEEGLLVSEELVRFEDGSVWSVGQVGFSGAYVVCVRSSKGHPVGHKMLISRTSILPRVTPEQLGELMGTDEDAKRCLTCEGIIAGTLEGECPQHAKPGKPARWKHTATQAEVDLIVQRRREGVGYSKIEKELGWPDSHGCRSWKIVKDLKIDGLK